MTNPYGSYRNEFLLTNRLGAYVSGNYLYGNTRKYHGLLVASVGALTRINVLNRLKETLIVGSESYSLDYSLFAGHAQVTKNDNLLEFQHKPVPTWIYQYPGITVTKEIVLEKQKNSVYLNYQIHSNSKGKLAIAPLISYRDMHAVSKFSAEQRLPLENLTDRLVIKLDHEKSLAIFAHNFEFLETPELYFNFYYPDEADRGYEASENLYSPGVLEFAIKPGSNNFQLNFQLRGLNSAIETADFARVKQTVLSESQTELQQAEFALTSEILSKHSRQLVRELISQSQLFVIDNLAHKGIVAGFPWFDEWSRDTFISLHGLFMSTGNLDFARDVLSAWGKYLNNGLLPNRLLFQDYYNSLDSVFWFVVRLYEYSEISGDYSLAEQLLPKLENIFLQFQNKTHNIEISETGLLNNLQKDEALTWMDAKINGKPVIDRSGYAVEIQALWYNYLRIMIILKEKFSDRTHLTQLKKIKVQLEQNFVKIFWNSKANCLFDVVTDSGQDEAIRPNQIMVLALPFQLLKTNYCKKVLSTVNNKLLTPFGLLTLAREDYNFHEDYSGNQEQRDLAYHQGTVWPFLLGFYLIANLRVNNFSKSSIAYTQSQLSLFYEKYLEKDLQFIPEVFSATELNPGGCLAQAWSVATLLETVYHLVNKK